MMRKSISVAVKNQVGEVKSGNLIVECHCRMLEKLTILVPCLLNYLLDISIIDKSPYLSSRYGKTGPGYFLLFG
jgi:hypothetical protein